MPLSVREVCMSLMSPLGRRMALWAVVGCLAGSSSTYFAAEMRRPHLWLARAAIGPEMPSAGHTFALDAGLMLKFVKPERTADFEATMAKVGEALAGSPRPERRAQAAGWRVFKAGERAMNGSVVYVFVIEPTGQGRRLRGVKNPCRSLPGRSGFALSTLH
jgi:hypothetical protein